MSVFIIFIFGNLWIKQPSFYSASRLLLHCWGFVGLPVCVWIGRDPVEPSKVTQNGGENTKSPERSPAASQEPADWCSQSSTSGTRRKNVKNTSLYQDIHSSIDRSAIHSFIQSSIIYSSIIHPLIIFIYPSFFPSSSIYSSICLSIQSFIYLPIYLSIWISIHSSICPFIYSSIHPLFTHLSVCSSIHPPIHPFFLSCKNLVTFPGNVKQTLTLEKPPPDFVHSVIRRFYFIWVDQWEWQRLREQQGGTGSIRPSGLFSPNLWL